jgi:lysophospholipase L1-like esterase
MKSQRITGSLLSIIFISFFSFSQLILDGQTGMKNRDIYLVYIGNSITQGAQLENPDEESPPATASEYLRRQNGVGDVTFINQGRSGYTTVDYLPSEKGALTEVIAATRLLRTESNRLLIFSVSLGTNDSAEKGPNGSPVKPEVYQQNLKSIADKLLSEFPGSKIIFQLPIWYSPNTYNSARYMAEGLARLQSYFPEIDSLVHKYSKTNPGWVFTGDQKGFEYFRNNYLTDLIPESGNAGTFYLHPNKKGSLELGKLWGEAIYQSILKN